MGAMRAEATHAIIGWAPAGIVFHNTRAAELFGYPSATAFRSATLDQLFVLELGPAGALAAIAKAAQSGPLIGQRADGTTFDAMATVTNADGAGLLLIRELPCDAEAHRDDLTEKHLAPMSQITTSVAHEFNNVLSLIGGYVELMRLDGPHDGRSESDLRQMRAAVERGSDLVHKLIDYAGATRPTGFTDLNAVIETTTHLLTRILPPNIAVETRLQPVTLLVESNHAAFERLLLNLALNARDAMPGGGTLAFETELADDHTAILRVRDTGAGMRSDTLRRAFTPFFTTKEPQRAAGLGLSVVRSTTREGGGSITATSELGAGTTFTLRFPLARVDVTATTGRVSR